MVASNDISVPHRFDQTKRLSSCSTVLTTERWRSERRTVPEHLPVRYQGCDSVRQSDQCSRAEDSFDLAVESARKFETMRRTTRSRTQEQIDVLRTYRLDATNQDHETLPDTTRTYRRANHDQRDNRYDNNDMSKTASAHNDQSYPQYQPRRGDYSYRGPYQRK